MNRILIADDEYIITMHMEELLTKMGYKVVGTAASGHEAVKKAHELKPDLVFMDIIMPGEKSGIDAANQIKEELHIPVIFVTAFADDKIVEKAKQSEPFGYIIKPFQGQEVKAAIEIALYKRQIERKLEESEAKYRSVVEESRDGIGVVQDGVLKFTNQTLYEMLGEPEEIGSTYFLDFFNTRSRDRVKRVFFEPETETETETEMKAEMLDTTINEFTLHRPDDTTLPVEVNTTVIDYEGGPAVLSFFRDISERKREEELLDRLVHEMNDNNQIVVSTIENVLPELGDSALETQLRSALDLLFNNVNLIRKAYTLLQVEHESETLGALKAEGQLEEAILQYQRHHPDKELQVTTAVDEDAPLVRADEFLVDVFLALLEHAAEHGGPTAEVEVSITPDTKRTPSKVIVNFTHSGHGTIPEAPEHGYETFGRARGGDELGLGLSIIRSVLERYNGTVTVKNRVEDDPNQGQVFLLGLPVAQS